MGQDISSLSEFTNAIGKVGEGAASLAEQYTNAVKPYIEATGTWDVDAIIEANCNHRLNHLVLKLLLIPILKMANKKNF